MSTYYKAVRPDGMDFHTGTINYAAALGGDPITLPVVDNPACCTSTVLHASTVPTETLVGGSWWPCRLFEVTGTPVAEEHHKRGFFSLAVVREVDAHQALGPQSEQVAALIERAGTLTVGEAEKLATAWDAAQDTAWDAARYAAWDAACNTARNAAWNAARGAAWNAACDALRVAAWTAWGAAWNAAWDAARDAARDTAIALVVRDLISTEHYDLLTGPWAQVIGPAHPDDTNPNQG